MKAERVRKYVATFVCSLALAGTAHAAVVNWNDLNVGDFDAVFGPLWTTPGDHTVVIGAGNFVDLNYHAWGSQFVWEGLGARLANSITIQGAGAGLTFIGSGSSNEANGWNRVNNTNMDNITFQDLSILNVGNRSMFGLLGSNSQLASVTFQNADVFLSSGTLVGRFENMQDPLDQIFFNNSTLYITSDKIGAAWDGSEGIPGADTLVFDLDSAIAMFDTGTYGAFTVPQTADAWKYSTSLVTVDDLYITYGAGNIPGPYGGGSQLSNSDVFGVEGDFFSSSVSGAGPAGWEFGETLGGGGPLAIPEPGTFALLALGGLMLMRRLRS